MSKQKIFGVVFLMLIFVAGIFVRFDNLTKHFTHVDDLLVSYSLMTKGRLENINEDIKAGVSPAGKEYENSNLYKTLFAKKDSPALYNITYYYFKLRSRFWRISQTTTYAPLQCGLTSWIIDYDESGGYEVVKFKGRILSCVFGILSMLAVAFVVYSLYREYLYVFWLCAFASSLLAFSWENIVYSQQMEPYTIAVFFHSVPLWILIRHGNSIQRFKHFFFAGLAAGLLAWGQYQLLFTGLAFIITLGILHWRRPKRFLNYGFLGLGFALAVYLLLGDLMRRSSGGVNWNAGENNRFLFSNIYQNDFSVLDFVAHTVRYFTENIFLSFRAMIGFDPNENAVVLNIFTAIVFVLMLIGVYSLFALRKSDSTRKALLIYLLCLSGIWVGLIVTGKITLSPTRHSMVLIPVFVLLAIEGLYFLCRKKESLTVVTACMLIFTESIVFAFSYSEEKQIRSDLVSESSIQSRIKQYSPAIISYGYTDNIALMRFEAEIAHVEIHSPMIELKESDQDTAFFNKKYASIVGKNPAHILFISTRSSLDTATASALDTLLGISLAKYSLVDKKEMRSDREIEYSRLTHNGTNELYYYVMKRNN